VGFHLPPLDELDLGPSPMPILARLISRIELLIVSFIAFSTRPPLIPAFKLVIVGIIPRRT
jgi:hypothetical protein